MQWMAYPGIPKFPTDNVQELSTEDGRYTCDELAEKVGISHGSVYIIWTRHLRMRRVASRWMPHYLTWVQMTDLVGQQIDT